MKLKLLVNFTCLRKKLKKDAVVEGDFVDKVVEKYSIEKLKSQKIIEVIEEVEEITTNEPIEEYKIFKKKGK